MKMKLATQFTLFVFTLLLLTSLLTLWVFNQVLNPEFERQKEEAWGYQAQQISQTLESAIRDSLLTTRFIVQTANKETEPSSLGLEVFNRSKMNSLRLLDLKNNKTLFELHKGSPVPNPLGSKKPTGFTYYLSGDYIWVLTTIDNFDIQMAFAINQFIDFGDKAPYSFLFDWETGEVVALSSSQFKLGEQLKKLLNQKKEVAQVVESSQWLVTKSLPELNIGIGIYGDNAQIKETWFRLLLQFLGIMLILLSFSLMMTWVLSRLLTKRLEILEAKSQQIGKGMFDISIDIKGQDEVGQLAHSMRIMTAQIKELFLNKEKQLRMESELKIAQTVQDTLFPPPYIKFHGYELGGYYKSASECGGDLWGYWETPRFVYFFILDATGHGVPAALITSASRAVVSLFESQPEVDIADVAKGFNYAINQVGNNLQQATAFICRLEKSTGELSYVNASHVSAYVLPVGLSLDSKIKEIEILSDPISTRLGEKPESKMQEGKYQIKKGEKLILVTDGLFDLETQDGKGWQERRALKWIIQSSVENKSESLDRFLDHLTEGFFLEHNDAELKDDVTLLCLHRH